MPPSEPANILAMDTSSVYTVLGFAQGDLLLAEKSFRAPLEMRDQLPLLLERFLRENESAHGPISAIAISIGPGSFTGLRVSLALAKGIAFARAISIWPVSSLKVLAANAQGFARIIASVIPARKGECYLGLFESAELRPLQDPICVAHSELESHVPPEAILLGPAVDELTPEIRERLSNQLLNSQPHFHLPSALCLARLAHEQWSGETPPEIDSLIPFYLKQFPA
jgi:tRNA threonylcarbamoyladenosine biosynthesis protein TsaB